MILSQFNALSALDAGDALRGCCGATKWVDAMLSRRPFSSTEAVLHAGNEAWGDCDASDWREAFSYHPRIGAKVAGREAAEQAGAQAATSSMRNELARINQVYEKKFGHIYLVSAAGKTAEEMLAIAEARLGNNPDEELRIAAEEQRKIMQLRLRKLLS